MRLNLVTKILVTILVLNISGVSHLITVGQAQENNSLRFINVAEQEKVSIQALGKDLLIQIKNAGTLSAQEAFVRQKRAPLHKQLTELNQRFKNWKTGIESYLMNSPVIPETAEIESAQKILLISDYFGTLLLLASVQAYSRQLTPLNQTQWIQFTSLNLSNEALGRITGYELSQGGPTASWYLSVLSDPNSLLLIAPDSSQPHLRTLITLNDKLITQVLELTKTNTPNSQVYIETLKKLILTKVQEEQDAASIVDQPQQKEFILRQILSNKIDTQQLPSFATDALLQMLLPKLTEPGKQLKPGIAEKIFQALQSAERERFEKSLSGHLVTYPSFISIANAKALSSIIAEAKAETIVPIFGQLRVTPETRVALQSTLDAYTQQYETLLNNSPLPSNWLNAALAELNKAMAGLESRENESKIQAIRQQAERAHKQLYQPDTEVVVAPPVLYMASLPAIDGMNPSRTVRSLLEVVFTAPEYRLAQKAFNDLLNSPALPDAERVQLRGLEKVFAFQTAPSNQNLVVHLSDLPLPEAIKTAYKSVLANETLSYPILSIPVGTPALPLYEALAKLPASASTEKRALIIEAIKKSKEASTRIIQKIQSAKNINELKSLIVDSRLLENSLMEQYPELKAYHSRLIDQFKEDSRHGPLRLINEAYHKPMTYLLPLFAADALLFFLRPTRPFVRGLVAFQEGFMPHVSFYLLSTLPLIATDFALQGYDTYHVVEEKDDERNEYFYGSTSANALYSYMELINGKAEANSAWVGLAANAGMTVAFLGAPFLARGAKNLIRKIQNFQYLKNFKTIGVESGAIQWSATSIQENAALQISKINSNTALDAAERIQLIAKTRTSQKSLLKSLARHEKTKAKYINDLKKEFDALGIAESERGFDLVAIDMAYNRIQLKAAQGLASPAEVERAQKAAQQIERFVVSEYVGLSQLGDVQARSSLFRQVYGFQLRQEEQIRSVFVEADYYAVFGVASDASLAEISQAYRRLVMQYHPDKTRNQPNSAELEAKFREVQEAWEVLGNPAERARYDLDRARSGAQL